MASSRSAQLITASTVGSRLREPIPNARADTAATNAARQCEQGANYKKFTHT